MDFTSIMQAAKDNKAQAQKQKEPVLKTKLSAPKKVEKKVDVEAIRKRLENQRKAQELAKKRAAEAAKPKPPSGSATSSSKRPLDKNTKRPADRSKQPIKPADKPKYDNKEHEQKHKLFMNKVQKPPEKKIKPVITSSKSDKKAAALKKQKPTVNPPSFKDLMKLAETVSTSPGAGKLEDNKAKQSKTDLAIPTNAKHKQSTTKQTSANEKSAKQISTNDKSAKHKQSNEKSVKHKQSNDKSAKSESSRNGKGEVSKQRESLNGDSSSRAKVAGGKRPLDSKINRPGVPAKKPALSESAMAKLALREGRRPPPPPSASNSSRDAKSSKANPASSKSVNKASAPQKTVPQAKNSRDDKSKVAAQPKVADTGVSAWDRLMGNSASKSKDKGKKKARRHAIDSDDEDDDLDGFIDDGGDDNIDFSAAIRDIFGYDKSRYRDEDFDDRSMVAGYADIMKEEVRSSKLALQEDLADIELEEQEKEKKRQKMLNKKKKIK